MNVPDFEGPWVLLPGDNVVIADYRTVMLCSDGEVADLLTNRPNPAAAIVELAQSKHDEFARAAIVVRHIGE
jgi:hypothetical protein